MTAPKQPKGKGSRAKRSQTTPIGRSILTKQRQALAREQAEVETRRLSALAHRQSRADTLRERQERPELVFQAAMQRSVIKRTNGVLISEGVNVPVNASGVRHDQLRAWTDFKALYIYYPIHEDQPELTAAIIRGLMYHEGGHVRFTLTFDDLVRAYFTEQGMFVPVPSGELRQAILNYSGVTYLKTLHSAWNIMEDQRMETAVVSDSPRKAAYFAPMVISHMLSSPEKTARNWPVLIWRRYLSHDLRKRARAMFVAYFDKHHPDGDGEQMAKDISAIVGRYVRGTNATDLMEATIALARLLPQLAIDDPPGEHKGVLSDLPGQQEQPDLDIPISPDMLEEETDDEESDGGDDDGEESGANSDDASDTEGDEDTDQTADDGGDDTDDDDGDDADDGDTDDDGDIDGDDDDDAEDGEDGDGAGGDSDDEPLSQEDLDEALADAEEERSQDETLAEDVRSFNEAKNTVDSLLPPAEYQGAITDPTLLAVALNMAEDMRRAFEAATVNVAPNWQEEQTRGIINVLRYQTRQPGNTEFFKSYNDQGNPGSDIAVTVMLDNSGSMGGLVLQLAQAAFASKMACQDLGIPCTVVLWNDKASMLWDANERAEDMPVVKQRGGTDPTMALEDLNNHVYGKPKHVVLIMTDGEWEDGINSLAFYDQPGRYFVGCTYGEEAHMTGAHVLRKIASVLEVPAVLEQALVECVR